MAFHCFMELYKFVDNVYNCRITYLKGSKMDYNANYYGSRMNQNSKFKYF